MLSPIKIDILYVEECPNYTKACEVICDIIADRELNANISITKVEEGEIEKHQFRGSPTVLINGEDVELCFHSDGDEEAMTSELLNMVACRIYDCDVGRGCPSHQMVECAIDKTLT